MANSYDKDTLDRLHRAEIAMLDDFAQLCQKHDIDYFAIAGSAIGAIRHKGFIPWDDDIDIAMLRDDYERFVEAAETELSENYYFMGPEFGEHYYNLQPALVRKSTRFVTDTAWAGGYEPGLFLDIFVYDNIPEDESEAKRFIRKCKLLNIMAFARNTHLLKLLYTQKTLAGKIKYVISGMLGTALRLIPNSDEKIFKKSLELAQTYRGKTDRYSAVYDAGATYMYVDKSEILPFAQLPFEDTSIQLIREYTAQVQRHMGKDFMEIPPEEKRTNHCPRELDFGSMLD